MKTQINKSLFRLLFMSVLVLLLSSNSNSSVKATKTLPFSIPSFQTIPSTVVTGIFYPGVILRSQNGEYILMLQQDYNLVLYKVSNGQALWASNTTNYNLIQNVQFQSNGNFVLYGGPGVWWSADVQSNITPSMFYWILQDDGNLCRYVTGNSGVAKTNTHGGRVSSHFGKIKY